MAVGLAAESTRPLRFQARLVDDERASPKLVTIELGDGLPGSLFRRHLDEREAPRLVLVRGRVTHHMHRTCTDSTAPMAEPQPE